MRVTVLLPLGLLAGPFLLAQEPPKVPAPPQVAPDVKWPDNSAPKLVAPGVWAEPQLGVAPAAKVDDPAPAWSSGAFSDRETVWLDEPGDGRLWVAGYDYKASFGAEGTTFVPFLGSSAPQNYPLTLGVPVVTVAGQALTSRSAKAESQDGEVVFRRGDLVEAYRLKGTGIEQVFRFADLPVRGELVVRIPLATELAGKATATGLSFVGPDGGVSYRSAVAIDGAGERLALPTELVEGAIRITVPAGFVARAALPLVIDPLIGTETTVSTGASALELEPDIAYDASSDEYLIVWQRNFSATDHDVWARRMDGNMNPVGNAFSVDFTSSCWEQPRVANLNLYNRNLVVAQVSASCTSPYSIRGRIQDAGTTTQTAQFTIADASVTAHAFGDKIRPDVGGDPYLVGPTYWTVVWERVISSTDHDIHMKQVTFDGNLRSASPTLIDNGTGFESHPSISKSDGPGFSSQQYWAVVYQRTFNSTDEDIRGATLSWDGQIVTANFSVDASVNNDLNPSVSSPTDSGGRFALYAYDRRPRAGGQSDIVGSLFDRSGTAGLRGVNLTLLEQAAGGGPSGFETWSQLKPSVDSDGCRFVLTYEEQWSGSGNDWDTRFSTLLFDPNAGTLTVSEARQAAGFSSTVERNIRVTSTFSSGGPRLRYAGVWTDDYGTNPDGIEAQLYNGWGSGGFSTRTTGCGGLNITAGGVPAIGGTMTFTVNGLGFSGFVFGSPANTPIGICPGCTVGVQGTTTVNPLSITIPCIPSLAGGLFAVQGFDFGPPGSGPCLNQLRLSDTIDITVQ